MTFAESFLDNCIDVISGIDKQSIEKTVSLLLKIRNNNGRLFVLGSGGGAGHASHATCDFRKLCNIEAYAPYDNVSELTARVNDDGWDSTLEKWLAVSRLNEHDGIFVFSVGGGNAEKNVSPNLVNAIRFAKEKDATILGVVGKDGGYLATMADSAIVIPNLYVEQLTPITEGLQAVIWHLLVSHPLLQINTAKWESISPQSNTANKSI